MEQKPPSKGNPEAPDPKKVELGKRLDMHSPEVLAQLPPEMQAAWKEKIKKLDAESAARKEAKRSGAMEDQKQVQQVHERIQQAPRQAANPVMLGEDIERMRVDGERLRAEKEAAAVAKREQQQQKPTGVWNRVKGWFR